MKYHESVIPGFKRWLKHYHLSFEEVNVNPDGMNLHIFDTSDNLSQETIERIAYNILDNAMKVDRERLRVRTSLRKDRTEIEFLSLGIKQESLEPTSEGYRLEVV